MEASPGDSVNIEYADIWLSASSISGIYGYTYGSYADLSGISIKGGHPKGNALFLNGILINQPQSSYADLTDISPFLFNRITVFEGGITPYSIYGNLDIRNDDAEEGYIFVNQFRGISLGYKTNIAGFDGGNLIGVRDTIIFLESFFKQEGQFWDLRVSRKRTSGMKGFPQTSGIQTDMRLAGKVGRISLLILRRRWNDIFGDYIHDNFRLTETYEISGFRNLIILEGVRSTNIGTYVRPIIYSSRTFSVGIVGLNANVWSDLKRLGYSFYSLLAYGKLIVRATLSNRIPSFDELYWKGAGAEGNPNLKNESSILLSTEVSYRVFYLMGFARRVWNIIEWKSVSGIWRPYNEGSGNIWGMSLKIKKGNFLFKYDRIWAYYDNGKRMIYRPKNSYFINFNLSFMGLYALYLDPRFTNKENTRFVDFVLQMGMFLRMKIKKFECVLKVDNLLDREDEFVEGYPIRDRTISLHLKYRR